MLYLKKMPGMWKMFSGMGVDWLVAPYWFVKIMFLLLLFFWVIREGEEEYLSNAPVPLE